MALLSWTPMQQDSTFLDRLERRKSGRVRCAQTHCQLGPIADLSRDGCRVICKRPIEPETAEPVDLRLRVADAEMSMPAHPVACRKRGDGRYDIGFKFTNLTDKTRQELAALARTAVDSVGRDRRMSA
jgi:PilZ domain